MFAPDDLPAGTLPVYPGLGQAPNMLAYIHGGVVTMEIIHGYEFTRWLHGTVV